MGGHDTEATPGGSKSTGGLTIPQALLLRADQVIE